MPETILTETPFDTLPPEEEAQAIEAARRNRRAFTPLYRAYVRPIYRYLYSRLGNVADTEDLTSQVFIEALTSLHRYRHQGQFLAWLFSIARHRLLNFQVRARPQAPLEMLEAYSENKDDPLSNLIQKEERERLLRKFAQLESDEQDLLRLRFAVRLSFGQMSKVLGRNEEAVKKQVYRLLARLESQLEADSEPSND